MENLQAEVQEMEFLQFSKGFEFHLERKTLQSGFFFTNTENKDVYWKNVKKLSAGEVGVAFYNACDEDEVTKLDIKDSVK